MEGRETKSWRSEREEERGVRVTQSPLLGELHLRENRQTLEVVYISKGYHLFRIN